MDSLHKNDNVTMNSALAALSRDINHLTTKLSGLELVQRKDSLQLATTTSMEEDIKTQTNMAILALLPDPEQQLSLQVHPHLTLKEFHLFLNLPPEIRFQIWIQVAKNARTSIQPYGAIVPGTSLVHKLHDFLPKHGLPVTFHVNQESRRETWAMFGWTQRYWTNSVEAWYYEDFHEEEDTDKEANWDPDKEYFGIKMPINYKPDWDEYPL